MAETRGTRLETIQVDESAWPVVVVRYPKVIEHGDFMRHLQRVVSFIKRREPWGMINDSRGAAHPNAKQRQAIATMYDDHEVAVREYWRGTAIIFDSQMIVGVLTALSWLRPPPHPFKAFVSYDDGERWVLNTLPPGSIRPLRNVG